MNFYDCIHYKIDKAIKKGRLFLIEPLIKKGNSITNKECCNKANSANTITYCLKKAIEYENIEIIKYILDRNKIIANKLTNNDDVNKPSKEKLEILPDYKICLNAENYTSNENILVLFLNRGFDLHDYFENPINTHLFYPKILKILLEWGYGYKLNKNSALSIIERSINYNCIESLRLVSPYFYNLNLPKKEIKQKLSKKYNRGSDTYKEVKMIIGLHIFRSENLNMILAHEYDENSLFYRDYLCHNLFKQILELVNIEYYLDDL